MSHVASMHGAVEPAESPLTPESWGKLGMWIFLAGDAVGFGTLLAGYGAMRATSGDWPRPFDVLGINLTAAMTFLLICSSVTMVKALEWLGKGDRTRARLLLFLTSFFLVTGFHGLHVTGGVIYLLAMMMVVKRRPVPAASYNAVEIAGLYWHFVDLVWIMVFTFMYLL